MTYLAANSPYLQNPVSSPPTSAIRTLSNTPGGGRGWICFCFTTIGDIGGSEGIEVDEDVDGGEDIFDVSKVSSISTDIWSQCEILIWAFQMPRVSLYD